VRHKVAVESYEDASVARSIASSLPLPPFSAPRAAVPPP